MSSDTEPARTERRLLFEPFPWWLRLLPYLLPLGMFAQGLMVFLTSSDQQVAGAASLVAGLFGLFLWFYIDRRLTIPTQENTPSEDHRTYSPEYADLPVKENSLDGYKGRKCPECGELGEVEKKIALEREDDVYSCWTVWYCPDCDRHWRASSRPLLSPFDTTTTYPEAHGYEVVGNE